MQKHALTLIITLSLPLAASAACVDINRTLKVGSTGNDVKALQAFLNTENTVRVSETGYFGQVSLRALSLFQERFADEILSPIGLNKGSGILGARTREKIRTLTCNAPGAASSTQSSSGLSIPVNGKDLKSSDTGSDEIITFKNEDDLIAKATAWAANNPDQVMGSVEDKFTTSLNKIISHERALAAKNPKGVSNHFSGVPVEIIDTLPQSAWPGMIVNIIGYGFGATNTVTMNGQTLEVYPPSENGLSLPVVIPADTKPGTYTLHIKGGVSEADASIEVLEK